VVNGCDTASYSTAKQLAHDTDELRLACEVSELVPRSAVYSREFCGGPHVQRTGFIHGRFVIDKDEKISRDVVRIKARLLGQ
jgi:alanyl-tRNA synthetase